MKKPQQTSIAVTPHSVICWIDAKQIPAIGHTDAEYVLVWMDTTRPTIPVTTCPIALGYQDGDQWFYAGTTEEILSPVTHWAPLPGGPMDDPRLRPCDHELGCTLCGMLACELDIARPVGLRHGGSMTFDRGECLFVDMHGNTWEVRETYDRDIPLQMSLRSRR